MGIFDRIKKGLKRSDEEPRPRQALTDVSKTLANWRLEAISGSEEAPSVPFELSEPSNWPDAASEEAEERLKRRSIEVPWHYADLLEYRSSRKFKDDYRVVSLRAGGIGVVYIVEITAFGEHGEKNLCAAKTLYSFLKSDYLDLPGWRQEQISEAFLEEALPWVKMGQHPNIVPVLLLKNIIHPQRNRNIPFVFSEFMPKGSLKGYLKEKGKLDLRESLALGVQLCDGLLHAYRYGINAHLDLKPDNIMIYGDGVFRVMDFSANVIGTPGYMAPEQVIAFWRKRGKWIDPYELPLDQRADQFAVGLIVLEAFLGRHPFSVCRQACDNMERAREYVERGVVDVVYGSLPEPLKEILNRVFSPRPDDRLPELSALRKEFLAAYEVKFGGYDLVEVEIDDSAAWWLNRGVAFDELGHYVSAESSHKEALIRYQKIPGTEMDQAQCFSNMGTIYWFMGRFSESEAHLKEALRIYRQLPGTETEADQAGCLNGLGMVYQNTGRFSEAEAHLKEALRINRQLPGTETEADQANSLINLGIVYDETNKFLEAVESYEEALGLLKQLAGTEIEEARCLANLGVAFRKMGRYSEAEVKNKEALSLLRRFPGTEIEQVRFLMNIGSIYGDTKRFSEAEALHKEALKLLRQYPGTELDQAGCLRNLASAYNDTNKFSGAEEMYKEGLEIFRRFSGTEKEQADCLMGLGNVYRNVGKYSEVEKHYRDALNGYEAIPGKEIEQARCLMNLGILYSQIQEFGKAREVLEKALKICDQYPIGTEEIRNSCLETLRQLK